MTLAKPVDVELDGGDAMLMLEIGVMLFTVDGALVAVLFSVLWFAEKKEFMAWNVRSVVGVDFER